MNRLTDIYYILKDNLGSWTTITDSVGTVEQEMSFDAWGNRRDPDSWRGSDQLPAPLFDRGFTGHEHLYAFGLINMNGRCYDPQMSSFLSVDAYVQSPDNSQNFNRYAYCLNNPLKYIDPTGWMMQGVGYGNSSTKFIWGDMSYVEHVYTWRELCGPGVRCTVAMAVLTAYRIGNDCSIDGLVSVSSGGIISDIEVIIESGKPPYDCSNKLNYWELNYPVSSDIKGKCIVTALGSTNRYWHATTRKYGDGTKKWIEKAVAYERETGKEFNHSSDDIVSFIEWDAGDGFSSYQASLISVSQIEDALGDDYVVGVCVQLNNRDDIQKNSGNVGHFANVLSYTLHENGSIVIGFIEPYGTNIMKTYEAPNTNFIWMPKDYGAMGFIKYKLVQKRK